MGFKKPLVVITLAWAQSLWAVPGMAADLRVEINKAPAKASRMYCALFDNAQAFSDNKPTATQVVDIQGNPTRITFAGLAEGVYALTIFADENGNGKLDTNLVGMPTEKYGFSNNSMGFMGPPKFDAAAVRITKDDKEISIDLH